MPSARIYTGRTVLTYLPFLGPGAKAEVIGRTYDKKVGGGICEMSDRNEALGINRLKNISVPETFGPNFEQNPPAKPCYISDGALRQGLLS